MATITDAQWSAYEKAINGAHDFFNQQTITWKKSGGGIDRNGEDNATETFTDIPIKALVNYNSFKTWASEMPSQVGELDKQTEVLLLNYKYLQDNNWINANGNFDYDPAADRFIHNGITYRSSGDTLICQAKDKPLLVQIVLQREETPTGSKTN